MLSVTKVTEISKIGTNTEYAIDRIIDDVPFDVLTQVNELYVKIVSIEWLMIQAHAITHVSSAIQFSLK